MTANNDGIIYSLPQLLQQSDSKMSHDFWDQLFKPLRDVATAKFEKYGFTRDDSKEAADEVILRVYKHFDFKQLEGLSSAERCQRFHAFVRKTAYSVFVERLRQRGIRSREPAASIPVMNARSDVPTRATLIKAFQLLTQEQQQLLRYKFIDGLTYSQIQEQYSNHGQHLRTGTLKMRIHRAVQDLRLQVSKEEKKAEM